MTREGTIEEVLTGAASWCFGNCDGFALSRLLGAATVDHVIGDPPYDARTHDRARSLKGGGSDIAIDFAPLPPLDAIAPALIASARRWTILFCALEQLGAYQAAAGEDAWIRAGLWVRTNGTPQISGDRPAQPGEGIAIMHGAKGKRWNRRGDRGVWTGTRDSDPTRKHPTKKPLWLMEALVRDFTDPGDLILDPTAGEGTTGEACIRLGRRFIGCEIDPGHFADGLERLRRVSARPIQVEMRAPRDKAKTGDLFS